VDEDDGRLPACVRVVDRLRLALGHSGHVSSFPAGNLTVHMDESPSAGQYVGSLGLTRDAFVVDTAIQRGALATAHERTGHERKHIADPRTQDAGWWRPQLNENPSHSAHEIGAYVVLMRPPSMT
jgi:hypothetical protein